jgi:hypothetical protein
VIKPASRDKAAARITLERHAERIGADDLRRFGRARVAQRDFEAIHHFCVTKRQRKTRARRLDEAQHNSARLPGRERIDAQLVVVAQSRLQQAWIDPAPHDVFEHLLRARFLDRHRVAQLAVDVECKAADDLTAGERKLQLAFEDAPVRVKELHLHARFGDAGRYFDVDFQRLQSDRLLGALHVQDRRSPRSLRRRRHQVLTSLGERGGRGRERGAGREHGAGREDEEKEPGRTGDHGRSLSASGGSGECDTPAT